MSSEHKESDPYIETMEALLGILMEYDKGRKSLRSILRAFLKSNDFSPTGYSEIQYLSRGILQHLNTIDFFLSRSVDFGKVRSMKPRMRALLRIGIYQSHWLEIPVERIIQSISQHDMKVISILKTACSLKLNPLISKLPKVEKLSLELSHPSFIVQTLLSNMSEQQALELMRANNEHTTTYVRMNKITTNSRQDMDFLADEGVRLIETKDIPDVYQVVSGLNLLVQSEGFLKGRLLIQDKASIYTVRALSPKPNEFVWDACAAPGMKTQLMWEMMQGKGRLVATEHSKRRLEIAKERAHSLGTNDVEWILGDASMCPIRGAKKILIDAPCSSTGMLRSHPSFKWRLNKKNLFSIMSIQNKILEGIISYYSDHPDCEIVYATCSILPHEGESQIDTLLDKYEIELMDIPEIKSRGYSGFQCSNGVRRLFPSMHNTDGFFIARMRIKQ